MAYDDNDWMVSIDGSYGGGQLLTANAIAIQCSTGDDAVTVASNVWGAWHDTILAQQVQAWAGFVVEARNVVTHEVGTQDIEGNQGAIDGEGVPAGVSGLWVHHTDGGFGRKNTGRTYVPGLPAAGIDATVLAQWSSGQLSAMSDIFQAFNVALPSGYGFCVNSRSQSTFFQVLTSTVQPKIAWQGRRRTGAS